MLKKIILDLSNISNKKLDEIKDSYGKKIKSLIDQLNNKNILFDELKKICNKDKDKIDARDYQITELNDLERYQVNLVDANNRIRKLANELEQNNNLSYVRPGKIKNDIKELTEDKKNMKRC